MADLDTPKPKSAVDEFVQTLGLIDLVLGGLALYWVRLMFGGSGPALFPSAGHIAIDLALLACAAAFAGRVVSFFSHFVMALVGVAIESTSAAQKLSDEAQSELHASPRETFDAVDVAMAVLSARSDGGRRQMERIRSEALLAYSAALLAIPYLIYFVENDVHWAICCAVLLGSILLAARGIVGQIDLTQTLRIQLRIHKASGDEPVRLELHVRPPTAGGPDGRGNAAAGGG